MSNIKPEYIKSQLPAGQSGDWVLEKFVIQELSREQKSHDIRPEWAVSQPGTYTRLRCQQQVFMTDLYDEWCTQKIAFNRALELGGHVLTTGLGIGMLPLTLLSPANTPVEQVTVVELSADVIRLVAPHLKQRLGDRLTIIQADAYRWSPAAGVYYSVIWHDIWPNPMDPVVTEQIKQLHHRYQPWGEWQGSWAAEFQRMSAESQQLLSA